MGKGCRKYVFPVCVSSNEVVMLENQNMQTLQRFLFCLYLQIVLCRLSCFSFSLDWDSSTENNHKLYEKESISFNMKTDNFSCNKNKNSMKTFQTKF